MCGCSAQNINSEKELVVNDFNFAPANNIREISYNCEEVNCKNAAVANLMECYGYLVYPRGLGKNVNAMNILNHYFNCETLSSWEEVEAKLKNNIPVLFKAYHEPRFVYGEELTKETYQNCHWVVLYGIDEDMIYISDPMAGFVSSERDTLKGVWEKCGKTAIVITAKKGQKTRPLEIYYQYPKYPAGCELASVCQVLRYYNYDVSIDDLLGTYLPVSEEEWIYSYYGDIYSSGFAFPNAICLAVKSYLDNNCSSLKVYDISKCSWKEYVDTIQKGVPLITWATTDYKLPRWQTEEMGGYKPWWNLHCITVYDIDEQYVYIADPIEGFITIEIEKFRNIWLECGSYAVAIMP